MLIAANDLERISRGEIKLVFRRWKRPTVKTGGTLKTSRGMLAIGEVIRVSLKEITPEQARLAGYDTKADLVRQLQKRTGDLYRIAVAPGGADPRVALRSKRATVTERKAIIERISSWKAEGRPWAMEYLKLIAEQPGVRAEDLANKIGVEKKAFKGRVRRLKELGLTESLKIGYRLSARGKSILASS